MPKGLTRSFSTFLRPLAGSKATTENDSEERASTPEPATGLHTTLDRVDTTLDRMSRALFAVDTVPKAVALAKASQMARSAGLREADGHGRSPMETTPPLARSINTRAAALARAAEELRELELRVHEANAFAADALNDNEEFEPERIDPTEAHHFQATETAQAELPTPIDEPPLLVDVVSLGPNVISLEPPAPSSVEALAPTAPTVAPVAPALAAPIIAPVVIAPTARTVAPAAPLVVPAARSVEPTAPTTQHASTVHPVARLAPVVESIPAPASPAAIVTPVTSPIPPTITAAANPQPTIASEAVSPSRSARSASASVQEEISLEVADDVNSDQLCQFLGVLPELMESIQQSTGAYTHPPHTREEGVRARNALRQLELAADSVGIRGIVSFASHATSLLDALINTSAPVPQEMFTTLRDAMRCLNHMSDVVWGNSKLGGDVAEQLEALIEAELRAILDLTLRVEEPSYSASFERQTQAEVPSSTGVQPSIRVGTPSARNA